MQTYILSVEDILNEGHFLMQTPNVKTLQYFLCAMLVYTMYLRDVMWCVCGVICILITLLVIVICWFAHNDFCPLPLVYFSCLTQESLSVLCIMYFEVSCLLLTYVPGTYLAYLFLTANGRLLLQQHVWYVVHMYLRSTYVCSSHPLLLLLLLLFCCCWLWVGGRERPQYAYTWKYIQYVCKLTTNIAAMAAFCALLLAFGFWSEAGPLHKHSLGHWNNTVEGLAQNVLKMYMEFDIHLYDRYGRPPCASTAVLLHICMYSSTVFRSR